MSRGYEQVGALTDLLKLHLSLCLLNPFGRSRVEIRSTDPNESPAVFTNFLDDARDVDAAAGCLQRMRAVMKKVRLTALAQLEGAANRRLERQWRGGGYA